MHASLLLLITSFAASAVAAPVPTASPPESPESLIVREADVEAVSPVLENLKREILERLDATAQRSVRDDQIRDTNERCGAFRGCYAGDVHDKRQSSKGYAGSVYDGLDGRSQTYTLSNDKRDVSSDYNPSTNDKRDVSSGYRPSANDKRDVSSGYRPSANDKRDVSTGYNPSANDKHNVFSGYNPSANDKRDYDE